MLRRFLPSVVAFSAPLAEVIVADNASTDDSLQLLRSGFPSVRVITLDRNYGFAEGYNRAISQVSTPYVLLLNSDVEVTPHYLEPLHAYLEANPGVAAVQPKLRAEWRRTHFEYAGAAGGFIDNLGYPFCRGRIFSNVEPDNGQYDSPAIVHWTTGAAMLARTSIYKELGGLDSRFFAHMEEIDLCWRMRNNGWLLACVPQSVVYHVGGGTLPQGNPRKTFLNFRNNLLMIYKNHPDARRVLLRRRFLDALAACAFLAKFSFAEARAVWRAHRDFHKLKRFYHTSGCGICHEQTIPSILWQYHVLRHRTFSQIFNEKQ